MVIRIIALCLIASSAYANWFEVWARGIQSPASTGYVPAGFDNSVFWICNLTGETNNIKDRSKSGTNTFSLYKSSSTATNYSFNPDGTFTPDDYTSGGTAQAYLQSDSLVLGNGATNWTLSIWFLQASNQVVDYAGLLTSRSPATVFNGIYTSLVVDNALGVSSGGSSFGSSVRHDVYAFNEWTCVTATKNSSTGHLWVGKTCVYTNNSVPNPLAISTNWIAGGERTSGRTLRGSIGAFLFITNYVYSSNEIAAHVDAGYAPTVSD